MLTETLGDGAWVTGGRDHLVALGERALCNESAETARCACDEPDFHAAFSAMRCFKGWSRPTMFGSGLGEHLGKLDQVAKRVAEECEAAADRSQLEWFGDDGDAA